MQLWKYTALFEEYKFFHNTLTGRLLYKTKNEPEGSKKYTEKEVAYF